MIHPAQGVQEANHEKVFTVGTKGVSQVTY